MVGIVDQALEAGGSDSLEIASYHEALVDFIKKTDTPMTIGVQGEWGSGKTSLLNQIWNRLEESNNEHLDDENYLQIWVNSWEHSLLCTPEECLLKIVNEIIQALLEADVDKSKKDKVKDNGRAPRRPRHRTISPSEGIAPTDLTHARTNETN